MFIICFYLILLSAIALCDSVCEPSPEQIHLSLAANSSKMMITWITLCPSLNAHVKYGIGNTKIHVKGYSTKVYRKRKVYYIHRTLLKRLEPDQRYLYRCGNDRNWSPMYSFKTLKDGEDWSPRLAVFGYLGHPNRHSIFSLTDDVKFHKYDIIYHIGAFGNESDTRNELEIDKFFREIEPITARVPYLTVPTNPIQNYNYSIYNQRFSMINANTRKFNNYYYSVNIGTAHIISFSTEFYYSIREKNSEISAQFDWLKNDLIEANKAENRIKRPWIITMANRPMIRKSLENLFYKYGVDLEMWGGGHSYERFWPFYNFHVYNGSLKEPYRNARAPIHIITAFKDHTIKPSYHHILSDITLRTKKLCAVSINANGYTRVTIMNSTHLHVEHLLPSKNTLADEIMIVKDIRAYTSKNACDTSQHFSQILIAFVFVLNYVYSMQFHFTSM